MIPTKDRFYRAPQQPQLPSKLATWLAEKWCPADVIRRERQLGRNGVCLLPDNLPTNVDIIVPISYTTLRGGLTIATHSNWCNALEILKARSNAAIVYSNCEYDNYPFQGSAEEEEMQRRRVLEQDYAREHFDRTRIIRASRSMANSVKECEAIRDEIAQRGLKSDTIVVVTGVAHARSAETIWQRLFPKSRIIVFAATDFNYEWQPDHYVNLQKGPWRWLYANLARQLLLNIGGVEFTGNFRHNSSRE